MHLPDGCFLQGGKYKIIRFISSGGFGCTYEAEHSLVTGRRLAIKELFVKDFCNRVSDTLVSVGTDSRRDQFEYLKKKFIEEGNALFTMDHPGIVRVTDLFEENGTAYYVMDYIDGSSLHALVKEKGALPESVATNYIRQVANALDYVHRQDRLHLDIKPGNIMVNNYGKAVIIDFGASKQYDHDTGEQLSTLLGITTRGYAPVEQMNRSFNKFSATTDIYSLGATYYKLLTGITPPDAVSLLSDDEVLEPLPAHISPNVRKAVEATMRLKAPYRPQSIKEFLMILDGAMEPVPLPKEDPKPKDAFGTDEDSKTVETENYTIKPTVTIGNNVTSTPPGSNPQPIRSQTKPIKPKPVTLVYNDPLQNSGPNSGPTPSIQIQPTQNKKPTPVSKKAKPYPRTRPEANPKVNVWIVIAALVVSLAISIGISFLIWMKGGGPIYYEAYLWVSTVFFSGFVTFVTTYILWSNTLKQFKYPDDVKFIKSKKSISLICALVCLVLGIVLLLCYLLI